MHAQLMKLSRWWRGLAVGVRILFWIIGLVAAYVITAQLSDWRSAAWMLGILLLALGLFWLISWFVHRAEQRRGREMEATLLRGMSREGAPLDESKEERDVRQQLERRWQQVYESLRERGYNYYSFPWYLIIGPAQSGKTTSIQKSDQEFPIGDKPVVDYGGTRGCNWFFTNQAVMIDTAGRYVEHLGTHDGWSQMEERDQEEWNTFLDLLRRMRSRSPVNGVVLTIKLEDVLLDDNAERERIIEMLRKALLDIEERLRVRVPVYVLVTMCDKLVGFVDFFERLPGLANRTLFGWSKKGNFEEAFDRGEFRAGFGELTEGLRERMIEFMEEDASKGTGSPADLARMDRLTSFPDEFATLGPRLAQMLEQIFAPTSFNEHHFCRGVYFTSGVQEGQPVVAACKDLLADRLSSFEAEDLSELATESKAYFIADLYQEKVFREQGLVRLTGRARADQKRKKWAYGSVAAAVLLAFTWFVVNDLSGRAESASAPYQALVALEKAAPDVKNLRRKDPPTDVLTLVGTFGKAVDHFATEKSDLYDTEEAHGNAVAAYRKAYGKLVLGPLLDDVLAKVTDKNSAAFRTWDNDTYKWMKVLTYLHALGHKGQESPQKTRIDWNFDPPGEAEEKPHKPSVRTLLRDLGALHNSLCEPNAQLNYKDVVAEADRIGKGDVDQGLAALRAVAKKRAGKIRSALRRYFDYWQQFRTDAGDTADPLLKRYRRWRALHALHTRADHALAELHKILGNGADVASLEAYDKTVKTPWTKHAGDVAVQKIKDAITDVKGLEKPTWQTLQDKFNTGAAMLDSVDLVATGDGLRAATERYRSELQGELQPRLEDFADPATYKKWAAPDLDTDFQTMSAGVTATLDGEFGVFLDAQNPPAAWTSVQARFTELAEPLSNRDEPTGAPDSYSTLRTRFKGTAKDMLEKRIATRFFQQAKATTLTPGQAYSAKEAVALANTVKVLNEGWTAWKLKVWTEGSDFRLKATAKAWFVAFKDHWMNGVLDTECRVHASVESRTKHEQALHEFSEAVGRKPHDGWKDLFVLPDFKALATRFAQQKEQLGDKAGSWVDALDTPFAGETDLLTSLRQISAVWIAYGDPTQGIVQKLADAVDRNLRTPIDELKAADHEPRVLSWITKQLMPGKPEDRKYQDIVIAGLENDPVLRFANRYIEAARMQLPARRKHMWDDHWTAFIKAHGSKTGTFPFVGAITDGRLAVGETTVAKAYEFLSTEPNLQVFYVLATGKLGTAVEGLAEPYELDFVRRCRMLRDLLQKRELTIQFRSDPGEFTVTEPEWQIAVFPENPVALVLNQDRWTDPIAWTPGKEHELRFDCPRARTPWEWDEPHWMPAKPGQLNLLYLLFAPGSTRGPDGRSRTVTLKFTTTGREGVMKLTVKIMHETTSLDLPDQLPDLPGVITKRRARGG